MGELSSDDRSAQTLTVFKKRIRDQDLTELVIDAGYKDCILCSTWHFVLIF